jgi:iron-sulfur cluster repair protein YtfE (RIC family)
LSDPLDLDVRSGLPPEWLYLRDAYPRDRWGEPSLDQMAQHWLQIHGGFRRHQAHMAMLVEGWRAGQTDAVGLHRRLIPALQNFVQHLDMHHNIESQNYFPHFAQAEPRIAAGIELLDRDHDAIHGHLEAMVQTGRAFHEAATANAPDIADRAARLAETLDRSAPQLARHLEDEEDIVIPLIALKRDPIG